MAFHQERWNENAGGMAGHGSLAIYDGSGTPVQGGETLDLVGPVGDGNINTNNFFDSEVVKDAVGRATARKTTGAGLLCLIHSRGDLILDVLELYNATVQGQRVQRVRCKGNANAAFRVTGA